MKKLEGFFVSLRELLGYTIYENDTTNITIATLLVIILAVFIVTLVLKLINKLIKAKLAEEDKNKFESILGFVKYLVYILVIVTILHSSGVNLTVLLTASAALFVGLGFALQYLFQDIISGILIILDQSLHVGDVIEVDKKVGRVFEIKLRTTRALTRDDKVIIIPNHVFLTNSIYNFTQNHKTTREFVKIGVAYGSDVALVTHILEQIAYEDGGILKEPKPFVLFDDFGDSALIFSIHFYINDSFRDLEIKSGIRYEIDALFRKNKINIPFPQRDVHLFQHETVQLSNSVKSSKKHDS